MKKVLLILLVIPFFSFLSPDYKTADFIGDWKGEDKKDQIGFIIFDDKGYASVEIAGQVLGGREFKISEREATMTYKINDAVDPIQVDFILTDIQSREYKELFCIAKFKDNDYMIFAMGFDNKRPTEFNKDNSIELERVK